MVELTQLGNELSIVDTKTVGATAIKISGFKKRKSYSIQNTSTGGQVISICLSNDKLAVAGSGIVLQPNQGIIDSNGGNYQCWSGNISAVSSAAGGTLAINEVI